MVKWTCVANATCHCPGRVVVWCLADEAEHQISNHCGFQPTVELVIQGIQGACEATLVCKCDPISKAKSNQGALAPDNKKESMRSRVNAVPLKIAAGSGSPRGLYSCQVAWQPRVAEGELHPLTPAAPPQLIGVQADIGALVT